MLYVRFDGLGCDGKNSCDFLVRSALGNPIQDLSLAGAERLRICGSRPRPDLRLIAHTITLDKAVEVRREIGRIFRVCRLVLNTKEQGANLRTLI